MTVSLRLRMERDAYSAWRERMDKEGIRFFRRKGIRYKGEPGPVELLSSSWNGTTGEVYCRYILERPKGWSQDAIICYTRLEPINEMEVIAICAAIES